MTTRVTRMALIAAAASAVGTLSGCVATPTAVPATGPATTSTVPTTLPAGTWHEGYQPPTTDGVDIVHGQPVPVVTCAQPGVDWGAHLEVQIPSAAEGAPRQPVGTTSWDSGRVCPSGPDYPVVGYTPPWTVTAVHLDTTTGNTTVTCTNPPLVVPDITVVPDDQTASYRVGFPCPNGPSK